MCRLVATFTALACASACLAQSVQGNAEARSEPVVQRDNLHTQRMLSRAKEIESLIDAIQRAQLVQRCVLAGDLLPKVVEFARDWPDEQGQILVSVSTVLMNLEAWGVSRDTEERFIDELLSEPNPEFQRLVRGRRAIVKLRDRALELRVIAMDGRSIDFERLRGKVVLIDFWASWCGSCLIELPGIRRVYEKYRESGFEVVGLACQTEKERRQVEAVLAKLKIKWPQALVGDGDEMHPDIKRFGIKMIPVTFLLDKTGRLVTTDINHGEGDKLESDVRRLLGLPPALDGSSETRPLPDRGQGTEVVSGTRSP